jgi:hypothetical protein
MSTNESELECEQCGKVISWPVAHASVNYLRKMLCVPCQIDLVKKTWKKQPQMMAQKLKELEKYL